MPNRDRRVYIAGSSGMVGSAIMRRLRTLGYRDILTSTRSELDLLDAAAVRDFFERQHIDQVYLAAARVGGILANDTYPADFISDNLAIQTNVIRAAHEHDVQDLLFLGSSCIYPRLAEQPIREDSLLTGPLEETNASYAVAKIAGIKLCEGYNRQYARNYRSVMPTNLYGPGDTFDPENGHVIPALMRRFHEAAEAGRDELVVWGSGTPRREFMHVDDMAAASVFVAELDDATYTLHTRPTCSHINIGTGRDCTIRELAEALARVTGFAGRIVFDPSKPDGTPRKLLDVSRLHALGWDASIGLEQGLGDAYDWFLENQDAYRGAVPV